MINASFNFTKDTVNEKLKSPFWRNFIIAWFTWNWKVWYITFFVNEEKIWNKIDYINQLYTYIDYYNMFPALWYIINWIIIPWIISFLIVFIITEYITHIFLKKQYELDKKELDIKNEYISKKSDSIDKLNELLSKEEKVIEKEKNIEDIKEKNQYEEWDNDYKKINSFTLTTLSKLIYSNQWDVDDYLVQKLNWTHDSIDKQIMILDTLWLITNWDGFRKYIITDKWKYFLKKYSLEENS